MLLAQRSRLVRNALVLGVAAGAIFACGVIAGAPDAMAGDWLSFLGALLGAAVTVAGSVGVLQWQRNTEERERQALLQELLDDADKACVPFQVANETALKAQYGKSATDQVQEVQAAIARIHRFQKAVQPKTARMMKVSDALASLAFHEPDLDNQLVLLSMYPDDADFGWLNALGHEVQWKIDKVRALLNA